MFYNLQITAFVFLAPLLAFLGPRFFAVREAAFEAGEKFFILFAVSGFHINPPR